MALVSIIIPCFNAAPWIRETILSVLEQEVGNVEIIVVDDGSTDESANIVEKEFPAVKLIKTENRGPSKARNLGTEISSGEFIQYLDADDLLASGKLKLQLEALEKSGADVAYGDWQKLIKIGDRRYIEGEKIIRKIQNPEVDLLTDFWCPIHCYLFRRSIVERVGGWNEGLQIIQDARFVLDCALQEGSFVYCEGVMAYYRVHSSESVSKRNPIAFNRDIFKNAAEVEEWWQGHGRSNEERKQALIKVYGYVARASFEKDRKTFESAYQALERLSPGYIPDSPKRLKLASQLIGYRKAEALALWYRRGKSLFSNFEKGIF